MYPTNETILNPLKNKMESILFYGNRTLFPAIPPISITSTQKSKPSFSLIGHNSTNSTNIITNKWRIVHPLSCSLNEPTPSKNGTKIGKGKIGAASIAMACVVGIIGAAMNMNLKAIAGPREMYQKAPQLEFGYPLGGRSALKSLLDVNVNLSSDNLEPPGDYYYQLPSRPSAEEVQDIKVTSCFHL